MAGAKGTGLWGSVAITGEVGRAFTEADPGKEAEVEEDI